MKHTITILIVSITLLVLGYGLYQANQALYFGASTRTQTNLIKY